MGAQARLDAEMARWGQCVWPSWEAAFVTGVRRRLEEAGGKCVNIHEWTGRAGSGLRLREMVISNQRDRSCALFPFLLWLPGSSAMFVICRAIHVLSSSPISASSVFS